MSVGSRRHSARAGDASDPVRVAVVSQQYPPEMGGNASRVGDTARQLAQEGWR
ncbi:hypothetical protein ACFQL1_08310 [Halomicroarcula sp. GCM10025709]|uniref:hypothetical protein n=1 Tax=Halomicroarcula sp. GCM10025709 TaxID=3252669 RepID=UPI003615B9BF